MIAPARPTAVATDNDIAKNTLRTLMRTTRARISQANREAASARCAEHILAWWTHASLQTVALYASIGDELSTLQLATDLVRAGASIAYPRVHHNQRTLSFHRANSPSELSPGRFGIPEPSADAPTLAPEHIDCYIVPGLAFDRQGNRLGWGRAHYDSTLQRDGNAVRIGYAYDVQIVEDVPTVSTDVRMTALATEVGLRFIEPGAGVQ